METKVKAQITPGPWHDTGEYDKSRNGVFSTTIESEFGDVLAIVQSEFSRERVEANARAIAALPELIEALREIANQTCDHGPQEVCPRETAQAALRKAGVLD